MSSVIPILPTDLYQYESYDRIVGVLDYLDDMFNKTMESVSGRIKECRTRVDNITQRVTAAKNKVDVIAGTTKALTVQSSPSFPKIIRHDDQLIPPQLPPAKFHPTVHEIQHPGRAPVSQVTDVKMLYDLYTSMEIPTPSMLDKPQRHEEVGLGAYPAHLSFVTSFLLFGSKDNPYLMEEQDLQTERPMPRQSIVPLMMLPDAPISLQNTRESLQYEKKDYQFQPDVEEVPKINMPAQLNMPGIANLDWEEDLETDNFIFALPSKKVGALPSLPNIAAEKPLPTLPKVEKPMPSLPSLGTTAAPQQNTSTSPTPPPPPPAPVVQIKTPPPPPPTSQNKTPPPPPPPTTQNKIPPPPPPPKSAVSSVAVPPPPKDVPLPNHPNANARNKMLDDLRVENPLARLKKPVLNEKTIQSKAGGGGDNKKADPFAQLKEQIARRFKEIHAPAVIGSIAKPQTLADAKGYGNQDSGSDWSSDED